MQLTVEPRDDGTEQYRVRLADDGGRAVFEITDGGPEACLTKDGTLLFATSARQVMVRRPDGTVECLLTGSPGEVAFVDGRGTTTIVGTAGWGGEHRLVVTTNGDDVATIDLGRGAPWLDWAPVAAGRIVAVRENVAANGVDVVLLHDGSVAGERTIGGRVFLGLHRAAESVVVTLDDVDGGGRLLRLDPTDLTTVADVVLPAHPDVTELSPGSVDLEFDEPADTPRRARYSLRDGTLTMEGPEGLRATRPEVAVSCDGTVVPVEVVLPAGRLRGVVVISYGCYGLVVERALNPFRSAVLDRGIGYAIVRVRGGGDQGPAWWHAARGATKTRAVDDLCAALDHLATRGVPLVGRSFSAGCTIQLAATRQRPDTFHGLVLHSPLLRLVDTDEAGSGEWGDPEEARVLCPTSQAAALTLPRTLLTAGFLDARTPVPTVTGFVDALPPTSVRGPLTIELGTYGHDGPPGLAHEEAAVAFVEDVLDDRAG